MEDLLRSVKAYLYDRAVSPLFGAFCVAWAVCNYRFILIIFSTEPLSSKFSLIDALYAGRDVHLEDLGLVIPGQLMAGAILPLGFTLLVICLYPALSVPVYAFSLMVQRKMNAIKKKFHDGELLTVEQSRELYRKLREADRIHASELSALSERVNELMREKKEYVRRVSKFELLEQEEEFVKFDEGLKDKVRGKLETLPNGKKFRPSSLFTTQELADAGLKRDFVGLSVIEVLVEFDHIVSVPNSNENDKELMYIVLPPELLEVLEAPIGRGLLSCFIGSGYDGLTVKESDLEASGQSDLLKVMLDKLQHCKFCDLDFMGQANRYTLTSFGREFLVDFKERLQADRQLVEIIR